MSDKSNQNNNEDKPELMSFAQRRAFFSQNIADQQNQYNHQPAKRRQSTPSMIPSPDGTFMRPRVPSPNASIVPPPQNFTAAPAPVTSSPPPAQQQPAKVTETAKPAEVPKEESKESIPSLSSSFKTPSTDTPLSRTSSSERSQGRVIWVKPDVKPANPLDSRNLKPDQVLSNDEAFKIARERRKSDSAVLYAQKMALKQSSGDMPKVFIPPPPGSPSPPPATVPPPSNPLPAVQVTERSVPITPPPTIEPPAQVQPAFAAAEPAPAAAEPALAAAEPAPAQPAPPAEEPVNEKPPPATNISSTELPKFGSPVKEEPKEQETEKKPNKDEPIKPQAFRNAFKFFQSLGVTPRRLSDDIGPEQKEISDLQQKIDSGHRKRAVTDIH